MHCCQKPRLLTNCTVLNAYAPVTNSSSVFLLYRPNNLLIGKSEKGLENPPSSVTAKSWTKCQVAKHKVPIVLPSEVKKTSADWMKVVGFTEEYNSSRSSELPLTQHEVWEWMDSKHTRQMWERQTYLYAAIWTVPSLDQPCCRNPSNRESCWALRAHSSCHLTTYQTRREQSLDDHFKFSPSAQITIQAGY